MNVGVLRAMWVVCAVCVGAVACSQDDASDGVDSGGAGEGSNPFDNPSQSAEGPPGGEGLPPEGVTKGGLCAEAVANTTPITPTVWLVLDGSTSMEQGFERRSTRWESLRSALMDRDGLVASLEGAVRFGMVLYAGIDRDGSDDPPTDDTCVNLEVVDPALDNFGTLDDRFPGTQLGGWTPTDKALEYVVDNLPVTNEASPDQLPDPTYVILATDGAPNARCDGGGGRGSGASAFDAAVAARVLDVTRRGTEMGMELFIVSLAGNDATLRAHLNEVAAQTTSKTPPFEPADRADLVDTLQTIVSGASCQIDLNGEVEMGAECDGEVLLNGNALDCGSDDGFRLRDTRTLQLTGTACRSFLSEGSQIYASFNCTTFRPD